MKLNHIKLIGFFLVFTSGLLSCQSSNKANQIKDVRDIESVKRNDLGSYEVICEREGTNEFFKETYDDAAKFADAVASNSICQGSHSNKDLICVFSGDNANVMNLKTNRTIGYSTTVENCQAIIKSSKNGFTCSPNGNDANVYRLDKENSIGYSTTVKNCTDIVAASNRLLCYPNGDNANLYEWKKEKSIGYSTTVANCVKITRATRGSITCSPNGNDATMYDLDKESSIGYSTKLETCLTGIPERRP